VRTTKEDCHIRPPKISARDKICQKYRKPIQQKIVGGYRVAVFAGVEAVPGVLDADSEYISLQVWRFY
jgi:hypothetical protein